MSQPAGAGSKRKSTTEFTNERWTSTHYKLKQLEYQILTSQTFSFYGILEINLLKKHQWSKVWLEYKEAHLWLGSPFPNKTQDANTV